MSLTPFHAASSLFRSGADTPRDFVERAIERYELREPELRAFVVASPQRARMLADAATERWRAGKPLSPIDGMPIAIKDVIETMDFPTGMGSPSWEGWRSGRDAAVVLALRDAGAIIFGKTKTTEYASTYPADTRNPHDPRRTPGGSTSGTAAAVGDGILPAGLGTQVIGSVLRPASFCGAVGFKPTIGGLNRGGSHDYQSQSCIGVIGASLSDAWGTAQAIVRRAGGDPGALGLVGGEALPAAVMPERLVLLETAGWAAATAGAKDALAESLARLRALGVAIRSRHDDPAVAAMEEALADAGTLGMELVSYESRWPAMSVVMRDPHGLSPQLRQRIEEADAFGLDGYRARLARRAAIREQYEALGKSCDGFVTLGAAGAAPVGLRWTGDPAFNVPASLLGTPAVSLPLLVDDGMPLGLQLMGVQHADERLFANALAVAGKLMPTAVWAA